MNFHVHRSVVVFCLVILSGCSREIDGELLESAAMGDSKRVEAALQRGANPDTRDFDQGATPLILAARNGNVDTLRTLVKGGADVNLRDGAGSPLFWACLASQEAAAKYLRGVGAKLGARSEAMKMLKERGDPFPSCQE